MSQFSKKILSGQVPTADDWVQHLIEAHKIAPSMTPHVFAGHPSSLGASSYEVLADTLKGFNKKDLTIIDLACGDGFLIPYILERVGANSKIFGVDMSEGELAVARKKIKDPRVTFHCHQAHDLPCGNSQANAVLCHMAFMLMTPLDPVVNEISRVLKPGGIFAAVTGRRTQEGLWAEAVQTFIRYVDPRYPKIKEANAGDHRVSSLAGLTEIFSKDFQPLKRHIDFDLEVKTGSDGLWEFMKDMYFVGMLPDSEKKELQEILLKLGRERANSQGRLEFQFPMKIFEVIKKT
jgi:ubiquinone/menaquinone biosynthesis C-methylase UbiE